MTEDPEESRPPPSSHHGVDGPVSFENPNQTQINRGEMFDKRLDREMWERDATICYNMLTTDNNSLTKDNN